MNILLLTCEGHGAHEVYNTASLRVFRSAVTMEVQVNNYIGKEGRNSDHMRQGTYFSL